MIDVNKAEKNDSIPLHLPILKGNLQCISLLMNMSGINLNAQDINRYTPLHTSASEGLTSMSQNIVTIEYD